ncbi:MAG: hypothetical protein JNL70_27090 [Saprospiraceae bacterium]|nr:hypothetical protein [Saprospiraceae bacterium]
MKLKIFISALLVLAFTPSVFSQNQMSVGNNIGNISYYMTEWTFTDVARMSDNWLTRSVGGSEWDSGKGAEVPTDANGYPLSIPFTAADGSQQVVHTIMPCYTTGEYTLVMKGKGSIYFRTPSGTVIHHYLTPTGGTFVQKFTISTDVTPQNTGNIYPIFLLDINQSDASDPIRDIKLIAPGFYNPATQSETEVFHPLFKQRLAHFSLLRYMDFGYTNGSPLKNFSERTLPTTYTQMGAKGAAIEYMADLANEIQKDMWVCIPHQATDDYVTQLANLLKTRVNADVKMYIEYSNETWNSIFSQTTYVQDKGLALNLSTDRYEAGHLYVARRSGEIFKIFQDIFGTADRNRLVFVMSTQNGSAWVTQQRFNALANPVINPSGVRADALSTAPYLTVLKTTTDICNGTCIPSVDDLLNEARTHITSEAAPTLQTMKTEADKNLVGLVCYEGGQHIVGLWEAINNQNLTDNMTAANKDARMYGIYTDYLTTLKNSGVQMFANFSSCGSFGKYGSWGLLEYQDQPEAHAPKYRAIKDWVAANPFTKDATAPSVPANLKTDKIYDASIKLSWTAATDNVGVYAYVVMVDGKTVGVTQSTEFLVPNLTPNTTYNFSIRAKDKSFNYSMPVELTATTLAAPTALVVCNFTGTSPASNAAWTLTSLLSSDITYSGILRGSGIVPAADINDAYGFSIDGTTARSTLAESIRDNEYISFKIAPLSNKALNLNDAKVIFKFKRLSGSSPQSYAFFSSVKGFEAGQEIYTVYDNDDFNTAERSVTFYLPENGYKFLTDTVECRIYMYNAQYNLHKAAITGLSVSGFTPTQTFPLGTLIPSNLQYNSVHLDWTAIANTAGFSGYDVFQNNVKLNTTPLSTTSLDVTNLTENLPYIFVIKAFDVNGNTIYQSQKAYITTPSRNPSYVLLNFTPADATTTVSHQRSFTNSGTTSSAAFNTTTTGQFFNTNLKSHQVSGGVQVDFAPNIATSNVTAFSLRNATDSYLPATLVISADNGTNPSRLTTLLMWTKSKFDNATTNDIVAFDNSNNSQLSITTSQMATNRALRFVIRNGDTYYVSEKLINQTGTHTLSAFGSSGDVDKRWGVFDPTTLTMPNPLPTFSAVDFLNVKEVGILYEGSRTAYGHSFVFSNFKVNGLVNPLGILPIEILDFKGYATKEGNRLAWFLAEQQQVKNIEIQKSKNGQDFTPLSILDKNETTVFDSKPFVQTYYKLKINELDGQSAFSKTILIENKSTLKVKIYPSTATDQIIIENAQTLDIVNAIGKILLHKTHLADTNPTLLNIQHLPQGIYILKGVDTEGVGFSEKIVKL